ncbi:MAG: hypothetical protein IIC02_04810 [Planctomycetes bacterium]|nr:hypothetical protein [Planctomycetota bacterium]
MIRRRPDGRRVERAVGRLEDRDDPRPIVGRVVPRLLPPPIFLEERERLPLERAEDRRDDERDRPELARDLPPREPRDAEGLDRLRDELLAEREPCPRDDRAAERDPPLLDGRAEDRDEPLPLGGPLCTSVAATAAKKTAHAIDSFRPKVRLRFIMFLPLSDRSKFPHQESPTS